MIECLLCSADIASTPLVATHARYGVECPRVVCPSCGLVQQLWRPTDAELACYYAEDYRREHRPLERSGPDGSMLQPGTPEYEADLDRDGEIRAANLADHTGPCTMLEVGCGDGRTAAAIARRGFEVWAVEADPGMRAAAAKRGVCAGWADVREVPESNRFAAVVSFHVLEHVRDPLDTLREMRARTTSGGVLLLEVPNVDQPYGDGLGRWYFQKPHLVDFSQRTLGAMVIAAGWIDARVYVQGHVLVLTARAPEAGHDVMPLADALAGAGATPEHAARVEADLREWGAARDAERALTALLDGHPIEDRDALVRAVEMVHAQGVEARRTLAALAEHVGAIAQAMQAEDRAIDHERGTEWHRGCAGGRSIELSRWAQAVGHAANAARVEG